MARTLMEVNKIGPKTPKVIYMYRPEGINMIQTSVP